MATTGLYTHRTRNAGEIVTDVLYNTAHKNQQINDVPNEAGALYDTLIGFRTTQDPAPGGIVDQVISLLEEFQQLRFVLADIKTALQGGNPPAEWYTPIALTGASTIAHGARVYRNTTQAIPQNVQTAATFTTVRYDTGVTDPTTDPFFSIGSPTRLTAKAAGLYQFNGFVQWATGSSGPVALFVRYNGGTLIAASEWSADGTQTPYLAVATQYVMAANDYVELIVYQNATATLNVVNPEFGLELLNPTAVIPPPTQFTLIVDELGTGSGTVTSNVGGINCPGVCSATYSDGATVILTATPTIGSFVAWSGDVPVGHETDNPLTLTMNQGRTVHATFTAYTLSITETGTGSGTVTSDVGGINCPGTCSAEYGVGAVVNLTATPTAGQFVAWSGNVPAGHETDNPVAITMNADKNLVATFALVGTIPAIASGGGFTGTRYAAPTTVMNFTATLANAQFTSPIAMEIVEIKVTLTAALGGGQTFTTQMNVNSVDNAGIVVSMVAGDQAKRATGSVSVIEGDLVTLKCVASTVTGVLSITLVYRPA